MTLYAKIDCAFARDPQVLAVSPLARLLYIQAILYCRENLTDGHIHRRVLPLIAVDICRPTRHMLSLVSTGLVQQTSTGWRIPGDTWSKWNPTRDEVEGIRAVKKMAGEQGNHDRWHQNKYDPKCRICIAGCDTHANRKLSPEPEPEPEPSSKKQNPPKSPTNGQATPTNHGRAAAPRTPR